MILANASSYYYLGSSAGACSSAQASCAASRNRNKFELAAAVIRAGLHRRLARRPSRARPSTRADSDRPMASATAVAASQAVGPAARPVNYGSRKRCVYARLATLARPKLAAAATTGRPLGVVSAALIRPASKWLAVQGWRETKPVTHSHAHTYGARTDGLAARRRARTARRWQIVGFATQTFAIINIIFVHSSRK